MIESEAKHPIKATKTTFRIIETLQALDGARVTELARELDMNKSSVHNYLSTLLEIEYVVKNGSEYHVGTQFLELGIYARNQVGVYNTARPEVDKLAADTGEWASLLVEEHGRGTYLHIASGEQAVPGTRNIVGSRIYLHSTALGKAILAHLSHERAEGIIHRHGLPSLTENTITDEQELFRHLETVREQGYARDDGERTAGFRCVAAPILVDGHVIGAVSVTGPTRRQQGTVWETDLPNKVLEAANVIEISVDFR